VNENFASLEEKAKKRLFEQGMDFVSHSLRREIDMRYKLQSNELSIEVKQGKILQSDVEGMLLNFETRYEELYGKGAGSKGSQVECITYRVFGIANLPFKPKLQPFPTSDSSNPSNALVDKRLVYLEVERGEELTSIFDYRKLRSGQVIYGPAIIELPTTTVVIPSRAYGKIDLYGNVELNGIS
jgi:N-methylhydantoinase A